MGNVENGERESSCYGKWSNWSFLWNKKGFRQGDSFSPLVSNIAMDILNLLLIKAQDLGLVQGLSHKYVDGGV